MKIKLHSFFIVTLISCYTSVSQNFEKQKFIDSLIKVVQTMPEDTLKVATYGTLYEKLMFRDPELSYTYAKKAYQLSETLNYPRGIAIGHLHFADYHKDRGNIDSARYYFDLSLNKFKSINFKKGVLFANHSIAAFELLNGNYQQALGYAYENIKMYDDSKSLEATSGGAFNLIGAEYDLIAGIHIELGNYNLALKEALKALKFFEEKKDDVRMADALAKLGDIELLLKNQKSALEHYLQAYAIYEEYKDHQYQAYTANSIGQNYLDLKEIDKAQEYFEKALSISKDIKSKEIEADALINLGSAFATKNDFTKSKNFLIKGLQIHRELNYPKSVSSDLIELAKTEIAKNQFSNALSHLDESIIIAKTIETKENLSSAYYTRFTVNKLQGNFRRALADHEDFKTVNDSIFNHQKSNQIEELRTIYQTEKKEQEIVFQKNEIELLQQKQKASSLQKTLLISGIIGLLVIFSLIYYALRQKMKHNKLIREQLDKDLEFKTKELTTHAMHLAKKNEVLEGLKQKAQELKASDNNNRGYQQLIQTINFDLQDDNNWENFTRYFEEVHSGFNASIKSKYPNTTTNELRLLALLKMNMSSKEIASILNISNEGVKKARYRLRKKLELSTDDSLQDMVLQL